MKPLCSLIACLFGLGTAGGALAQDETPPVIGMAPCSQTQPVGGTAVFSVEATGTGPLSYQWRKDGIEIPGAVGPALVLAPVALGDAATYDVVVTNSLAAIPSTTALLATVSPLPLASSGILHDLAGYWRFDESLGCTAADTSGRHHSGALTNFPRTSSAYWTGGKIGGALRFGGTSSKQHVVVSDFPKSSGAYTLSAWVWAEGRPAWASIAKNWVGEFYFGLNSATGQLSNFIGLAGGGQPLVRETTSLPINAWHHVACVADGAQLRLYRNGVQVGLTNYTDAMVSPVPPAMGIGARLTDGVPDPSTPGYWQGLIDDLALWNRALSVDEIRALHRAGSVGLDITHAVPATPPSGLVISEYMADNVGGAVDEDRDTPDWIELCNGSAAAVDLDGYFLTDSAAIPTKWRFPAVTLGSGQYLLVWASGKDRRVPGAPLHTNFQIDLDGEDLALVAPDGVTVVHRYETPFAARAPTSAPWYPSETNVSFGLREGSTSTAYFPIPTPGQINMIPVDPRGAIIDHVAPPPGQPEAGQAIPITARVRPDQPRAIAGGPDSNRVASASLHYRLMYGAEATVAMNDDGVGDDAAPNDGLWTGTIPAALGTTAGQMVRWYVTAITTDGDSVRSPRRLTPGAPEYEGTVIADPSIVTPLPVIHRFVEKPSAAEVITGTRCEIFYDGEFYDRCFTRIRGNTSLGWPKKSYKVEFNKGHSFRLRATQSRVDEFDLNTTYTDKSYVRAQMVSEMYRAAGLPCVEIFPVQVRQNAAFYSVALYVEQPDGPFLRRHRLDPAGSYYKAVGDRGACDFTSASAFEKKTRLDEGIADLQAVVSAMSLAATARETWLFDNLDVPAVINFMAGVVLSQNIDASNKNYFIYRDTGNSREWMFLPWDLDLSLGPNALNTDTIVATQSVPSAPQCPSHPFLGARPWQLHADKYNRLQEAVVANPRTRAMLVRRLRSQCDQFLATNWFQSRMDELKPLLQTDVEADHARWKTNSHFNWSGSGVVTLTRAMDRIKNEYLAPRLPYLTVAQAEPATVNFTTGAGRVGIPASQVAAPAVVFGEIDASPAGGDQDQEYIELRNPGSASVDLSGWTLDGGMSFAFKGGTVLLPGESVYVTPSRRAFRQRLTGPRGGERRFVTGDASGHLSALGEWLILKNADGTVIATTATPADPSDAQRHLRITEVHFHPPGDGLAEFIELQNTSARVELDLGGVHFSDGVEFAFPAGTRLAAGERLVVVRNEAAFRAAFGAGPRIAGEFQNSSSLNNAGERLALDDALDGTIQSLTYSDAPPWPASADGGGASLHFVVGSVDAPAVSEAVRWFAFMPNPGVVPMDTDADGQNNDAEWRAGTDAGNAASIFQITRLIAHPDGSVAGTFDAVAGRTYRVLMSSDLRTWESLGADLTASATGNQAFNDPGPHAVGRYYKVVVLAP